MPARKPSPAENEKKAPKQPKGKATPKKPTPAKKAKKPAASAWRAVKPNEAPAAEPPKTPGTALMVIPQPEPPPPKTPWQEFKDALPDSLSEFMAYIASGGHMAGWCGERGIAYTTMLGFVSSDPRRAEMYARAREDRADVLADEIVAISDEETIEIKEPVPGVKIAVFDKTAVARNRLRVDARKWVAAKLRPRVYGDKLEVESTVNHKAVPDEELIARLAAFGVVIPAIVPQPGGEGGGA